VWALVTGGFFFNDFRTRGVLVLDEYLTKVSYFLFYFAAVGF
jgi:hypothetical protein